MGVLGMCVLSECCVSVGVCMCVCRVCVCMLGVCVCAG